MCKVFSVISGKGGVGKTTSVVNISSYIAMQGKKVLAIDIDPLHNLTTSFGVAQETISSSVSDLMMGTINEEPDDAVAAMIKRSIYQTEHLSVIPATNRLKNLEKIIPSATSPERIIEYLLSFIKEDYDYIFLDCCAGLNMFVTNALVASDSVLIAVEAHVLSSDAIVPAHQLISTIRRRINPQLEIEGVIVTKYQGHTNYCQSVRDYIKAEFGADMYVFGTPVNYAIKVAEAPSYGLSIHQYAPNIQAAKAYADIACEVMHHA